MATGSTLGAVLALAKGFIGTTGTGDDVLLYQMIANEQGIYTSMLDWSFLEDRWDVVIPGQSRFNSFPTTDFQGNAATLRLDRDLSVDVFYNQIYTPLDYGIGEQEYNTWNPDLNQFQDPIEKWMRIGTNKTKFEVWPVPATQQTVRFVGQKLPAAFSSPPVSGDICDLDDMLLALTVAAKKAAKSGDPQAGALGSQARNLFLELRGNDPNTMSTFKIGKDMEQGQRRRIVPLKVITIHG